MSTRTPIAERRIFTTGQIAKMCEVAPRTVSKWIDSGTLEGYQIPRSKDRRVHRAALLRFMKANGFSLDGFDDTATCTVLLVGFDADRGARLRSAIEARDGYRVVEARDALLGMWRLGTDRPRCVLVDLALGRLDAGMMAGSIRDQPELDRLVLLAIARDPAPVPIGGIDNIFAAGVDPDHVADQIVILTALGRKAAR